MDESLSPAKLRRALGLAEGDEVLLSLEDGSIRISTRRQRLEHAQALVGSRVAPGRSLAAELIAERHRKEERD